MQQFNEGRRYVTPERQKWNASRWLGAYPTANTRYPSSPIAKSGNSQDNWASIRSRPRRLFPPLTRNVGISPLSGYLFARICAHVSRCFDTLLNRATHCVGCYVDAKAPTYQAVWTSAFPGRKKWEFHVVWPFIRSQLRRFDRG